MKTTDYIFTVVVDLYFEINNTWMNTLKDYKRGLSVIVIS